MKRIALIGPHDGVGTEMAGSDASNSMAPVDMIHFGFSPLGPTPIAWWW